jgi:uroporphyrinogen-III synthase
LSKAQHLAGKRILITRARHQAARLAEALEAHGAEVLRLPTIEIVPPETYAHLDAALEVASGFDWLIVTSANGAAALADRMQFLGIPLERLKHLQVAAIGPATAAAITRIGLKVAAMPEEYVAEAVVAMLRERVAGKRVLLARAAVARDVIPEQLRRCGADIHVAEAYRTIIPADSIVQVGELLRGKAAARRRYLYQFINGEQLLCPSRRSQDGAAGGAACGVDRPSHHAHFTPA